MKRRKALTNQQLIMVAAVVVILLGGIWYFVLRPTPEPTPNVAPVVLASATHTYAWVGNEVGFDASGSLDTDGQIEAFEWDLGDGSTASSAEFTHIYEFPGDYLITLTIVDDDGDTATNEAQLIYVKVDRVPITLTLESPPIALIGVSEQIIDENDEVTFDGASSYGWKLRRGEIQPDLTKIADSSWDFGDGTTGSGLISTHMYATWGNYHVQLTVTDQTGQTDTVSRTIRVSPPGAEYVGQIKNPDTFVYASGANIPTSLDLWRIGSPTSGRQMQLELGNTLLFQGQGDIEPKTDRGLAESYEISEDGLHYTFYLREGVKFWNGDELKAEDIEYTFERMMALTAGRERWSVSYERITGISREDVYAGGDVPDEIIQAYVTVLDDYTVRFNLVEQYAPFLRDGADVGNAIIQKSFAIENGAWDYGDSRDWKELDGVDKPMERGDALMCTGAYKVIEWSPGERLVFERHEEYWEGVPSIEFVRYFSVPEFSTRRLLVEAGDVDGISVQAVSEFEQLLGRPGIQTVTAKYRGFLDAIGLGINFDENLAPPENQVPSDFFADVHMRRAFAYALPYDKYVQEIWLGYATPARGVLPLGWPGAFESYPYEHDLEKAEAELKLAHGGKYWEEGFTVVGGCQSWALPTHGRLYEMWAEEFAKIDPKFKVGFIVASYGDMMRMPIGAWIGTIDMDPIAYRSYMHSEGWSDYYGYNNPEVDELIELSTYTPFMDERLELLREACEIVADEVPFLFTVHTAYLGTFRDYIGGLWYPINAVVDAGYWFDLTKGE